MRTYTCFIRPANEPIDLKTNGWIRSPSSICTIQSGCWTSVPLEHQDRTWLSLLGHSITAMYKSYESYTKPRPYRRKISLPRINRMPMWRGGPRNAWQNAPDLEKIVLHCPENLHEPQSLSMTMWTPAPPRKEHQHLTCSLWSMPLLSHSNSGLSLSFFFVC